MGSNTTRIFLSSSAWSRLLLFGLTALRWKQRRFFRSESRNLVEYPAPSCFGMPADLFDKDKVSLTGSCREARCARPSERVEHDVSRSRIRLNDRLDCNYRLLIGVVLIAGIFPRQEIRQRICRFGGFAFGKEKPRFMKAAGVPLARTMGLYPYQVTHGSETRSFPGCHE